MTQFDDPMDATGAHRQPTVEEIPDTQESKTIRGSPTGQTSSQEPIQAPLSTPVPPQTAHPTQPSPPIPTPAQVIRYNPPTAFPGLAIPQSERAGQTKNAQGPETRLKRTTKNSISISLVGQGPRFNIREFLTDTTITLSVAQLLDRSPQIRTQAYEIALAEVRLDPDPGDPVM
ncbi:MAG: hypothetical protein M1826_003067 [Phylliscum demangeonii]|nr:MAG: hypothetical protein M1826_003067 [Phylliscum demangeonii]